MTDIWGHRGCRGLGNPPENSLAAFQAAIDQGAQGFELDVCLSRDEQLVVFHDNRLERMTDGKSHLTDHTLIELKRLRLKNPDGRLSDQTIPSYEEVLNLVERHAVRERPFIIATEIKGRGIARFVAAAIRARLNKGWHPRQFHVSSFHMQELREIRRLEPCLPIGVLLKGLPLNGSRYAIGAKALARRLASVRDLAPDTVNLTYDSLTPAALRVIANMSAKPVAWTAGEKNPAGLTKAARRGMVKHLKTHGITLITDYPGEMLALLQEYATDSIGRETA